MIGVSGASSVPIRLLLAEGLYANWAVRLDGDVAERLKAAVC